MTRTTTPTNSGPTQIPIHGQPATKSPSSTTPTFTNKDGSLPSGTPIARVKQISNHLLDKNQDLPRTLQNAMASQDFKQAPHKVSFTSWKGGIELGKSGERVELEYLEKRECLPNLLASLSIPKPPLPFFCTLLSISCLSFQDQSRSLMTSF